MADLRALRSRPHPGLIAVLALAAVLGGGCGNDDSGGPKLSRSTAASLRGTLDQVQEDVASHNCTAAAQQAATLRQQVDGLGRVRRSIRRALASSASRLQALVADQCQSSTTTTDSQPATEGASGASGASGTTGETSPGDKGKGKKNEKPKKPKPGKNEGGPPTQQGDGGGAGLPGETGNNGGD